MSQYQKEKSKFLDLLKPDDFRNPSTFNQAEIIIDQLSKSCLKAREGNSDEFMLKAASNLFRQDSLAADAAIKLAKIYLEENK
jgi:hypothetical protein